MAGSEGFPIPFLFWIAVAIYTVSYTWSFHLPTAARLADGMQLGFGVHLLVLLARSVFHVTQESQVVLPSAYVLYWKAVWASCLVAGLVGLGRFISTRRSRLFSDPQRFFLLPLTLGYATLWVASWWIAPRFTIAATLIGLVGWASLRGHVVRAVQAVGGWLWRDERAFLVLVFLLALAFRLFYAIRILSTPDFLNTGSDGPAYDALAWALVHGEVDPRWGHIPWFAPGYVRFLAIIYALVGRHYFVVCAVQSLVGAIACLLLFSVAKRIFNGTVARISAVFGALNYPMVFAAAAIGHQAMDLFWTLLVVWCLVRYAQEPRRWGRWIVGIGLLLGWAAVTREGNAVFWVFLVGWFLWGVRAKVGWRTALTHVAGLSVGVGLMLVPILGGGGSLHGRLAHQWFSYQNAPVHINTWFNPWKDPGAAWSLLREEPLTVFVNVTQALLGNFNAMFMNQSYGAFDPVFLVRWSPYYYGMWWYAYLLAFFGLLAVVWGAVRSPVDRLGYWLILVVLSSRASVHLFFEAGYRHRVPLEPYLILLAAYGLTLLLALKRPVIPVGSPEPQQPEVIPPVLNVARSYGFSSMA